MLVRELVPRALSAKFEKFEGNKNRKTGQKCLLMYAGAVVLSYIKSENAS